MNSLHLFSKCSIARQNNISNDLIEDSSFVGIKYEKSDVIIESDFFV